MQRGLGLLAVALIAFLFAFALGQSDNPVVGGFGVLAGVVTGICVLAGLVLIAVGLLRD